MLIVLEGLDGAGKSTQLKMIDGYLSSIGRKTSHLHFPRYEAPVIGDMIGSFLRGDFGAINQVHPKIVAYFFAEDRHGAAEEIRRMMADGYVVILDRYVYSNIAFQGAKIGDAAERKSLRDWILDTEYRVFDIPRPDLNLFLDVPISFVDDKLHKSRKDDGNRDYLNGKSDIHEADIEFQKKVREVYLAQCAEDPSFIRIDCADGDGRMLKADAIFEKIKEEIGRKNLF